MAQFRAFLDYVTPSGRNDVHAWLLRLPVRHRMDVQATIRFLEQIERPAPGHFKRLGGGLIEVRVTTGGVAYRPVCFEGPRPRCVTILIGATERDSKWDPPKALDQAKRRMRMVLADPERRTCEHHY